MSPLYLRQSEFTLRTLCIALFTTVVLVGFLCYVLFQARFFLLGPQITLTNELPQTQTERAIYIEGTVQNIVRLSLNGRQIFTDASGYFRELIILEQGYTQTTLRAEDRYGRQATVHRSFVYTDTSAKTPDAVVLLSE